MHVAVDLDVLDHFESVGLETTVEVMEIMDAADAPGGGVEEFCGNGLRQRIVALALPAGDEVIAVAHDHAVEFRDLVGGVLKVGVHSDDHVAFGGGESGVERGRLSVVSTERDAAEVGILLAESGDDGPGAVGAAVVDEDHFIGEVVVIHDALDPCGELGKRLGFVVERYDN